MTIEPGDWVRWIDERRRQHVGEVDETWRTYGAFTVVGEDRTFLDREILEVRKPPKEGGKV